MSEPKRQHPAAAIAHAAEFLRKHYVSVIIIVILGVGKEDLISLAFMLGPFVFILVSGFVRWYWFTYQIVDQELRVKQGLITHHNIYIPFNRIQAIDITRGVVQRALGLVALEVKTAGKSSTQAKISAIRMEEAEQIRTILRAGASDQLIDKAEEKKIDAPEYKLSTKDLLIAASTSDKMGLVLSLLAAAYQIIDQIVDYDKLFNIIQRTWQHYATASAILLSIIGLLLLAWLITFGYTMFLYYKFSVRVQDNELTISRGLLTNVHLTIPLDRIQAIQIKEGIFRQPFGYATLLLEDAGYATTTLMPLITKRKIPEFIAKIIPEYNTETENIQTPVPPSGLRRYLLRKVWKLLPVIILCWIFIPYGIYTWILLAPAFYLGWLQYKDAGIRVENNSIVLRSRVLSRRTGIVKKRRIQSAEIRRNPFQSRLNIGDFSVYVASGKSKRTFKVRELPQQTLAKYWKWLSHERQNTPITTEDTEVC